jgi:hypothetical protein
MHATTPRLYLQTFQHEVFAITPTLDAGSRCSRLLVMATIDIGDLDC